MAKQQTEEELNLRRKARRRLTGAIALTLAVVVILPMVLDGQPKSTGNDIDLSIPDPGKAGPFAPRVAVPGAELPSASSPAATGSEPSTTVSDSGKSEVVQNPPKKDFPVGKMPALRKSAETPGREKQVDTEGYVAQIGAYANADTAKQEYRKLKQWGFKAYTEKVGGNIRVRVGPYPDRAKAEKVGKLLEKHGLHPVIVSNK